MSEKTRPQPRLLIVDDEQPVRDLLVEILGLEYECHSADSAETALGMIASTEYAVIISDIDMPGISGIELVPRVHARWPNTVLLMISGNLSIDYAVQAIRVGAFDYVTKPFELDFVELSVRRAVDHHRLLVGKKQYETDLEQLVKQRTEEINFLIYHDSLTNLPNRVLFEDRLSGAVIEARHGGRLATVLLSLDGFEKIQDHFGHATADTILEEVAKRLQDAVPGAACLSRLQGNDFAILLTKDADLQSLVSIADRIREAVKRPMLCRDTEVFLTTSIGISVFPNDGSDAQELMRNAGNALWRARESGGDSYQFYSDGMNADTERRLRLEGELRRALERDEFQVFYQPKVSVDSNEITGVEALVRWNHPEKGTVSPAEFIPLAEETGLIVPLGEKVLEVACRDALRWHQAGHYIDVAVNVSARQMKQGDLAERFEEIIERSGLHPTRLNLEVTETSMMENTESAIAFLERLRSSGVRISLDDFGTGYSSLSQLKNLPIDHVKIDRSFISDIKAGGDDAVVTLAMVNLARNLRLKVVAEGVETAEQLTFLRSIGCDEYQGFYFSKPISEEDLQHLLGVGSGDVQFALPSGMRPSISPQELSHQYVV
jgi:diguanylate cyclase (GGDEF)-like protein